jgi:hypothetical protein
MVMAPALYALESVTPWQDIESPGVTCRGTEANPHPTLHTNLTSEQIKDEEAIFNACKEIYDGQQSVKRAVIAALNNKINKAYRRATGGANHGIGEYQYRISEDPRDILDALQHRYPATPLERTENDTNFNTPWDPSTALEEYMDRIETAYIRSLAITPAFTPDQLLRKGYDAIAATKQYEAALLEWDKFDASHKTWANFKAHVYEKYDARVRLGHSTASSGGYGYAGNTVEADADDDSIGTLTNAVTNYHMAANANAQRVNDNFAAIAETVKALQQMQLQQQQQLAMMTNGYQVQPIIPGYIQGPPPPTAPAQYAAGGRRPHRGRRNRGGRGQQQQPYQQFQPAVGPPPQIQQYQQRPQGPPQAPSYQQRPQGHQYQQRQVNPPQQQHGGNIPPPPQVTGQQQVGFQGNPYKYYNNWNMCCTCGFDIPSWHTSKTCPQKHINPHHNDDIDRNNYEAYEKMGWKVSKKARHKGFLPLNPSGVQNS